MTADEQDLYWEVQWLISESYALLDKFHEIQSNLKG